MWPRELTMKGKIIARVWCSLSKETEQVTERVREVLVPDEDAKVERKVPPIIVSCVH